MNARLLLTAALVGAAMPAAAQTTAPTPVAPGAATVSISAEHRIERRPDVADISAGVVTSAPTATAAISDNAGRMTAVIAGLRRSGIAERDIQTSGLSLQPQYVYHENQPPQLSGYQAINNVTVQVRKIDAIGRVIAALVQQGANQIGGPTFRLDRPDEALDAARVEALRKARGRADLYAKAAGLRVGRILQISEGGGFVPPPYPVPMARAEAAMAKDAGTPVAPGEVQLAATVNVVFELQ